ncbi:hypothetical protein FQN54_001883 [Arachnomyces sp. PD_36]|nr:hypothetical protein FQN54_001883 [Arachnomyces sp. PD_36]
MSQLNAFVKPYWGSETFIGVGLQLFATVASIVAQTKAGHSHCLTSGFCHADVLEKLSVNKMELLEDNPALKRARGYDVGEFTKWHPFRQVCILAAFAGVPFTPFYLLF